MKFQTQPVPTSYRNMDVLLVDTTYTYLLQTQHITTHLQTQHLPTCYRRNIYLLTYRHSIYLLLIEATYTHSLLDTNIPTSYRHNIYLLHILDTTYGQNFHYTPLYFCHQACQYSVDPNLLASLLYFGKMSVVNERRNDGFTPLHLVSFNHRIFVTSLGEPTMSASFLGELRQAS